MRDVLLATSVTSGATGANGPSVARLIIVDVAPPTARRLEAAAGVVRSTR